MSVKSAAPSDDAPHQSNLRCRFCPYRFIDECEREKEPDDAERDIDEEYRAPVEVIDERAADERAEHGCHRECRGPDAERLRALFHIREGDRDNRHRRRIIRRHGESLDDAEHDHGRQIPRERAQARAMMNPMNPIRYIFLRPAVSPSFPHTGTNTAFAKIYAVEIHAASRNADTKIADDLRQGKIDHRLVKTAKERAEDDGAKHPPAHIASVLFS